MTVCSFWLQNRCQKGAQCTFEHTNNPAGGGGGFGGQRECKFHAGGGCRDGDRCKFAHTGPPGSQAGRMGFAQQPNRFGGPPQAKNINQATNINATRIKETQLVKVEMLDDWPNTCAITCYAAVSSSERRRNILEDDWSVEEIRWEAYKANSGTGGSTWDVYCKNMEAMTNDQMMKRKAIYENPDLALNRLHEQPPPQNPPNCFGTQQVTNNPMGQNQQQHLSQFGSRIGGSTGFGARR